MPITPHDQPVYHLTCGRDDVPAEHDDGMPIRFDSHEDARRWARDYGWRTPTDTGDDFLCPPCVALAEDQEHHQAEINAAIIHALSDHG